MHRRNYTAYWDLLTPAELEVRNKELAAETARMRALEAATIVSAPIEGAPTAVVATYNSDQRRPEASTCWWTAAAVRLVKR